jgi:hypothetical protein
MRRAPTSFPRALHGPRARRDSQEERRGNGAALAPEALRNWRPPARPFARPELERFNVGALGPGWSCPTRASAGRAALYRAELRAGRWLPSWSPRDHRGAKPAARAGKLARPLRAAVPPRGVLPPARAFLPELASWRPTGRGDDGAALPFAPPFRKGAALPFPRDATGQSWARRYGYIWAPWRWRGATIRAAVQRGCRAA